MASHIVPAEATSTVRVESSFQDPNRLVVVGDTTSDHARPQHQQQIEPTPRQCTHEGPVSVRPVPALSMLRDERRRDATSLRLHILPHRRARPDSHHSSSQNTVFPLETGITEIAGSAGAGKTQLALGLCVTCALHQRKTALYLSLGEGSPQAKIAQRLQQMLTARSTGTDSTTSSATTTLLLDRIWTRSVRNEDELQHFLQHDLPLTLRQTSVGVVILDSLAAMFRVAETTSPANKNNNNNSKTHFARRSQLLFRMAAQLKRLSDSHQVPMVVVNQVSANFSNNNNNAVTLPALGLSWANCVDTSYWVSRREYATDSTTSFRRSLTLRRSSHQPTTTIDFRVDEGGPLACPND